MHVLLAGAGGSGGWPLPQCGCASCARAGHAGRARAPAQVVVDGVLRIGPGGSGGAVTPAAAGYRVAPVPGGWDVTGPDGARLLVADGSGDPADPPASAGPYDLLLLDLLASPAQLGALRLRGLARAGCVAALVYADHRVFGEEELARRCGFWGVVLPRDGDVLASAAPSAASGRGDLLAARDASDDRGQPRRVLVLGGARSGKSRHAELRLAAEPRVTYLAAGPYPSGVLADDPDWARRVAAHQSRRPTWWRTVENADPAEVLRSETGAVLFDGAGTWLAAVMQESGAWAGDDAAGAALPRVTAKVDELVTAFRQTPARAVIAVSDEVGSSVHPATSAGRLFRDHLGWLNQRLAAESEEAVLMVAGRALSLPG
jgi:adenosylcobinamide kinase / adenosylcobinamide-phosphate guanylyltransferase